MSGSLKDERSFQRYPVALRIVADGAVYSMLRLDKAGTSIAHTWHASLEDAKAEAAKAFGVAEEDWLAG